MLACTTTVVRLLVWPRPRTSCWLIMALP